MADELWQAFIQVTGSANAFLLGGILILSPRLHKTRSRHKLGAALLAYGYLLLSFTAVDNFWVPTAWWIILSDYVIVLLASALFLDYVSGALGRGNVSRLFYLPPIAFLVFAMIMGTGFILGRAINVVIVTQIAYTCLTTWVYLSSVKNLVSRVHHLRMLIIGLWILHAFQFSRMLLPGVGWVFDLVPLAGAALILTFTVLVLTDSRSLMALSQVVGDGPASTLSLDAVDLYMKTEKPHLDSRLTLGQLARAMNAPERELSAFFGKSVDGNFYNFVNRHRVQEAKDLLGSAAEARTSVEAIGLMAGFRSRSTFYDAFRKDTGKTPAQFRKELPSRNE